MKSGKNNSGRRFRRVLIANRGEIALRVIRCLRELGIESVAVYSDADERSLHRFQADYAIRLPGQTSAETYLNVPVLLDAMRQGEVDAVHPGYGFLSENADFAQKIIDIGVTFIGPSPDAMHKMGDKVAARKIMRSAGVPIVPGSEDPLRSWQELKKIAQEIGYPLIIKAAAGGGGRGMQVVRADSELAAAYDSCTRQAQDYFGNPEVFCERFIEHGRHIEFQVLGDMHGNAVHLFERDCTVQRRHQKLIEEAPSQFISAETREKLGEIVVRATKAVGYCGAGTLEFICESPEKCYFMEMNTRIQVEHCVTELVTGIDLIREQILVCQGAPLSLKQSDITLRGCAMELRINTEDATQNFAPMPGVVSQLQLPAGPFVRVDSHLYEGYKVPEFYDSMVAKIMAYGRSRQETIEKLLRALSEFRLQGMPTTAPFHEQVLQNPHFLSGEYTTRFVEENLDNLVAAIKSQEGASILEASLDGLAIASAIRQQQVALA